MKAQSKRLGVVLKVYIQKEKKMSDLLRDLTIQKQQEEEKLTQLYDYQKQYDKNFHEKAKIGVTGAQLHSQQHFMDQLSGVIKGQHKALNDQNQYLESVKQKYMQMLFKRQCFEKLIKKMEVKEQYHLDKAEQKLMDELTMQMMRAKHN
ncbi:MAG: flagellar export protein FliJ [Saccharospirillaceae bacterium]|nr:flagellar export protein FliJ [Pseudomonadales bacterium]NRB80135.1 flagellar export protein FliJ [Saccharospirillaceae bacterium]